MRPDHRCSVLRVFILAGLQLTLNVDGEDSDCELDLISPHNTVYEAFLGEHLWINCTVVFCSDSLPLVSWYKREASDVPVDVSSSSHIKTEWKLSKHLVGISFLIFQKVRINDSGVYHCQSETIVSHNIKVNVSVHGNGGCTNVTRNNDTSGTPDPTGDLLLYVYFSAGIGAFVIIVIIISVVSMRGCKGKPKKETQTENQYMAIPMVERPVSHAGPQPLSRGSPSAPPSQRSTPRPDESPSANEHAYGKMREDRERRGLGVTEVVGSIVYAALNHQLPAPAAARPRRPPREETSEYAAIRIKEPSPTRLERDIPR